MDITGPHPPSRQGHIYMVTIQDHFSKWAEAFPNRRHTPDVVARFLFHNVVLHFGAPLCLLTDQGDEFEEALMGEL